MAIPTSRTKEKAEIRIDHEKCSVCGSCVEVCKDFSLVIQNGRLTVSETPCFGCIACGHCMAICPTGAIKIHGRTLSPDDLFSLSNAGKIADYQSLQALLQRRRSIREFKDVPVEPELIQKILDAVKSAPMGLPPSDVHVLILDTKNKVNDFARDYCEFLQGVKWIVSGWFMALMRPFWGKSTDELFREFVKPLFEIFIGNMERGTNLVTYDAPLAMYFYATPYADPADPIIAATYAMLAAESLGLGTCMIGGIHPMIQNGRKARKFRQKQGIRYASREGLFVIFGHPGVKYLKGVNRTLASIDYHP
jgi:nitroreductase/NAD-dependent dihydropyrimidine dehydrogenase PreA subunit